MKKIKCLCGEEFLDNDCFASHWRECSSSALSAGLISQPLRIKCGEGKIAVHDGTLDGVPCLSIGNNGAGDIGSEISQPGGVMAPEVELVTVTFTNKESVDVWIHNLKGVKARLEAA